MQQLIQITTDPKNGNVISARELYEFLEVKTEFTKWCSRMFEYGFKEGRDFTQVTVKNDDNSKGGKSTIIDYALTLETSKHIGMIQRSEKGRQIREYFIACEEQLRLQAPTQLLLPPRSMTLQLAEWSSKKPEIDYRTPILSLHRFYRKPNQNEECDYLNIYELKDFTVAFGGNKVQIGVLKRELKNMGIEEGWTTINGKQKFGYKITILPFTQK